MELAGRVAIVSGAAGNGMGRSIALTLAREGASVVVNYRSSRERAEEIVEYIQQVGGHAAAVQADIFTENGCRHLANAAEEQFGQVDICLIGPGAGWHPEPLEALDAGAALEDLHAEVAPLFYLMPLVLPGMYTRQWGRVIGLTVHPTKLPSAYAYNATKAARTQAFLLAQDQAWAKGVTINLLAPGPISPIATFQEAIDQCNHGPAWQNRGDISPQDIAEGVIFLCSEAGKYVSGCVLPYLFRR